MRQHSYGLHGIQMHLHQNARLATAKEGGEAKGGGKCIGIYICPCSIKSSGSYKSKFTHTHTQRHTCRLPGIVQASSYIVPHPLFNSIFWPKRTFHDGSGSGNGSGSSSRSSFPVPRPRYPFQLTVVLVVPTASGVPLPLHLPLAARLFT